MIVRVDFAVLIEFISIIAGHRTSLLSRTDSQSPLTISGWRLVTIDPWQSVCLLIYSDFTQQARAER